MCGVFILLTTSALFYICLYSFLHILEVTASSKNCGGTVYTGVAKFWWIVVPSDIIIDFLFIDDSFAIFSFDGLFIIYVNDCVQLGSNISKCSVLSFY